MLPALLLASTVAIPTAGRAVPSDETLRLAERVEAPSSVLDSQQSWQQERLDRQFQEQWVEASWGQVTWARAIPKY